MKTSLLIRKTTLMVAKLLLHVKKRLRAAPLKNLKQNRINRLDIYRTQFVKCGKYHLFFIPRGRVVLNNNSNTLLFMAFKLNSPITEDMFKKILDNHGAICIYRFKADEITTSGFSQTVECDYWHVKTGWATKPVMYYNRVPINTSVGDYNQEVNKTPAGILKFVNKMIEDSKGDKTISVIVVNVPALFTLKGKQSTTSRKTTARKTKRA